MIPRPSPGSDQDLKVRARLDRLSRESQNLDPRSTLILARLLLARLDDHGADYADFQSAQHTGRAVRKAVRALANTTA